MASTPNILELPAREKDRPVIQLAPNLLSPEALNIEVLRFAVAEELRARLKAARDAALGDERLVHEASIRSAREADLLRDNLMVLYTMLGMNPRRSVHAMMLMEEGLKNAVRKRFLEGQHEGRWIGHHVPMEKIEEDVQRVVAFQHADVKYGIAGDCDQLSFMMCMWNEGKSFNPYKILDHRQLGELAHDYGRGLVLMGEFGEVMGARVMYLPENDTEDPAEIQTRELLLSMPVTYTRDEAALLFKEHAPKDPLAPLPQEPEVKAPEGESI